MKGMANSCRRSFAVQSYDQIGAAQHQIEGSIANLFLGNWPAAITLAGAAEEILAPHETIPDLYTVAKTDIANFLGMSDNEMHVFLNEQKIWLKHDKSSDPSAKKIQKFEQQDAVIMIFRALTRFRTRHGSTPRNEYLSENIAVFLSWVKENYTEFASSNLFTEN